MLAATLLFLAAEVTPAPDYRQAELTDEDKRAISLMCEASAFNKAARQSCVKDETEKLRKQKQAQVDARAAEALTSRQTAH